MRWSPSIVVDTSARHTYQARVFWTTVAVEGTTWRCLPRVWEGCVLIGQASRQFRQYQGSTLCLVPSVSHFYFRPTQWSWGYFFAHPTTHTIELKAEVSLSYDLVLIHGRLGGPGGARCETVATTQSTRMRLRFRANVANVAPTGGCLLGERPRLSDRC